nr:(2Fe-2S)-binding protein [Hydrogenimonas thermophila]
MCYCKEIDKKSIVKAIKNGAKSLKDVKVATNACTGNECKEKNPNRRCCSNEINQLIQIYGEKMEKDVKKTVNGVKISFTGEVKKENIIKMVENCATGQCECMSDATKKKIQNMEVKGEDGAVELELTGEIEKEEIEAALQRSKVLNQ